MGRAPGLEVRPGTILTRLSREEAASLLAAWLAVFGRAPAPHMTTFPWHVFSAAAYPSLARQAARDAYVAVACPAYVVLSNTGDEALVTDQKPTWCSAPDCYVFPRNLAWTMAFTHEDGWLGPFFARHPDFERLQGDNLKGLRKAQRAAAARQRGWS
ncbi:MAG: hypothetical protein RLZ32_294 [Gemmatimonadota bacterium]|jgi:hypothetical protein